MAKRRKSFSIAEICLLAHDVSSFTSIEHFLEAYSKNDKQEKKESIIEMYDDLVEADILGDIKSIPNNHHILHNHLNPYPRQFDTFCKQSVAMWFLSHGEEVLAEQLYPNVKGLISKPINNNIKPESTKENNNQSKIIGVLCKVVVDMGTTKQLIRENEPNYSAIAKKMEQHLPSDTTGLSNQNLRKALKKGIDSLSE
ncbi:MAG: hypothetical protein ACJASU_001589 [Cognaticolwellia sp.]|jgi:hypothetical protein